MYCDRNSVAECAACDEVGLDVAETSIGGEIVPLCPACNLRWTLGDDV